MKKLLMIILLILAMAVPVSATDIAAPPLPEEAEELLSEGTNGFSQQLWEMVKTAVKKTQPQVAKSMKLCLSLLATGLLLSVLQSYQGSSKSAVELSGVIGVSCLMLGSTGSMISLGIETIENISHYGRLLLPVMTAALAAQGGITSSGALYAGTALFDSLLCSVVTSLLIPMAYVYLVLSIVNAATADDLIKKLRGFVKWALVWVLKCLLYVFTGYITLTGVITGTADQTAVKAAKLTISGMVPVVGGILSDASETILVSAALAKNTVGISGMLVILSLTILPFFTIGIHYLLLKVTAAISGAFSPKSVSTLMEDFTVVMGLVLAMTGAVCLLQLISAVCFLRGMG